MVAYSLSVLGGGLACTPALISSGFGPSSEVIHQFRQYKPAGKALIVRTDPFGTSDRSQFLELAGSLRRNARAAPAPAADPGDRTAGSRLAPTLENLRAVPPAQRVVFPACTPPQCLLSGAIRRTYAHKEFYHPWHISDSLTRIERGLIVGLQPT